MTAITESEALAILDEICADIAGVELQEGDLTANMIVKRTGCSHNTARLHLEEMVNAGRLVYVGEHKHKRGRERVYRPVTANGN